MNRRAKGLGGGDAAANFDGFNSLHAHHRPGQQAVKALIPVGIGSQSRRGAVDHDLEDAAHRIAGARDLFDLFFHAGFGGGIDATEDNLVFSRNCRNLVPLSCAVQLDAAYANDVAGHFNTQSPQQQLGQGSGSHAGSGFAGRCALQHVAGVGKVVLEGTGQVGVTGTRRGDRLVLGRVAGFDGQLLFPVFPVAVDDFNGNRRADGLALAHAGENVGFVGFNLHAAATAKALLAAPQLTIHVCEIDRHTGRHSGDQRDQGLSVRLAGS